MDPYPEGPKLYGSFGSGSATLQKSISHGFLWYFCLARLWQSRWLHLFRSRNLDTYHCRQACRDPDNLYWLASSLVERLTPEDMSGHEFESPAAQTLVRYCNYCTLVRVFHTTLDSLPRSVPLRTYVLLIRSKVLYQRASQPDDMSRSWQASL